MKPATPLAAVLVLASFEVAAQTAALPSFDLERLELDPSATGSLLVGGGELLPEGGLRLALAGHYARNPLVAEINGQRVGAVIANRWSAVLTAAYAPTRWLELGFELPGVLTQNGVDLSAFGIQAPTRRGFGSPTVSARFALLSMEDESPVDLSFHLGAVLPFGRSAAFAGNSRLALEPKLLLAHRFAQWGLAAELGALVAGATQVGAQRVGSHLTVGGALTRRFGVFRAELGAKGLVSLTRLPAAVEFFLAGRLRLGSLFELFALIDRGLGRTPGTPSYRALFGLALQSPFDRAPRCAAGQPHDPDACPGLDADGDGVLNRDDSCPRVAEDADGFDDADGCPDPDNDADGVADADDACRDEPGLVENRGCPRPDADGDGVLDDDDACPNLAGPPESRGCPFIDRDNDGTEDPKDKCPDQAGPKENRGCPVLDGDEDGVPDDVDNCPKEAGPAENQGCPAKKKQLVVITRDRLVIKDKVYFATNSATISRRSFQMLNQIAEVLVSHPEISKVVVEGHTDNRGNVDRNRTLSQRRADAVRAYLITRGVNADLLEAKGYGPDRPLTSNLTARGREENRRVEFTIPTGQPSEEAVP